MKPKKINILITGGTGFLGSQIAKQLLNQGFKNITILGRKKPNYLVTNKSLNFKFSKNLFKESFTSLKKRLKNVDILIHAAWYVNPKDYLVSEKNFECLEGTINLAKAASECGVKKFVGIGTCFEYDLSAKYLSTKTKLLPKLLYSACKASVYLTLSRFFNLSKTKFKWCRVFYLFGENEKPQRLYPLIIDKLKKDEVINLGEGKQIRDYMNVKDAAKMIINFSMNNKEGPKNICSGIPISIKNFALSIAKKTNKQNLLVFKKQKIKRTFDPNFIVGIK